LNSVPAQSPTALSAHPKRAQQKPRATEATQAAAQTFNGEKKLGISLLITAGAHFFALYS
jgi:hypothetical protein